MDHALGELESLLVRALDDREQAGRLASEVQTLGIERARIADALDRAEAKIERLEHVNREVSRRLVAAMETIRQVLRPEDSTQ